ncbi:MAG: cytochrome c peroxidase [Candidatus Kapaibacterium sp.]
MKYFLLLLISFYFMACKNNEVNPPTEEIEVVPTPIGFPKMPVPLDNKLTEDRILLGKKLFFDKQLSSNQEISCSSCHLQNNAFSDSSQFSLGINKLVGERNTPPLFNLAWNTSFFWDGGVPTLEQQVIGPITNPIEMNMTLGEVIQRITKDTNYLNMFKKAYDTLPSAGYLTKSIASFMRSMVSSESKYDKYINGDTNLFNDQEKKGLHLFFGESVQCHHCHIGYNFTTNKFANNGSKEIYKDLGRKKITKLDIDLGKFKIPSLRNIAVTSPYMHDGSYKTLEEVIENYNKGGSGHPNQDPTIYKLNLSNEDKNNLIAFLKTLTDQNFISNPK